MKRSIILLFLFIAPNLWAKSDTLASKDPHRHFILPTAKPIDGGWLGVWELGFLQGGFGIEDILSVTGGITVMPTVSFKSQIGFLQAKATLADEEGIAFAIGANVLRMTSSYFYTHGFISATAEFQDETRYTALFFLRATGEENPDVMIFPYGNFTFNYTGILGAGIGFDRPIPSMKNIRFLAEIWNHDLSSPRNVAVLAALRLESERFSSDFGLMYFAIPLLVPVANFVFRF